MFSVILFFNSQSRHSFSSDSESSASITTIKFPSEPFTVLPKPDLPKASHYIYTPLGSVHHPRLPLPIVPIGLGSNESSHSSTFLLYICEVLLQQLQYITLIDLLEIICTHNSADIFICFFVNFKILTAWCHICRWNNIHFVCAWICELLY